MSNNKKLAIGKDTHAENTFKTNLEGKKSRFNELLSYCNQFVLMDDINAFSENPKEYFINAFKERYENEFPAIVTLDKRLELSNIDIQKIGRLESEYKQIEITGFDPLTLSAPEPDFNIYAIDKEAVKRYENTKILCDLLNELRNEFQVYPANVIQGVSGAIGFNFQTNKFDINVAFINQIKSRAY
jgi:hypothetical protein